MGWGWGGGGGGWGGELVSRGKLNVMGKVLINNTISSNNFVLEYLLECRGYSFLTRLTAESNLFQLYEMMRSTLINFEC